MKIGIIVIWFNPDINVVNNLKTYYNKSDYLYIIDNSAYSNKHLLGDYDLKDNIKYVELKNNYGIAKALNIGMKLAIQDQCEWVVTMDQDSYWKNDLISIYTNYLNDKRDEKVAILSPQYETERSQVKNKNGYKELKRVMQSANMINCNKYIECGEFIEKLFIDCVDYEYCYRVRRKGYKIIQCEEAVLIHSPAITKKKKILFFSLFYGYASEERYYYQVRNALYLFRKYKDIYFILIVIYKFLKVIILFDNKNKYINTMINGIIDCKNNNFGKREKCNGKRKN